MSDEEIHEGGCACGAVRYRTSGHPARTGICHCRHCQLRTGSAFGVSVYFPEDAVEVLSGDLREYPFQTESGRAFTTRFCTTCGTSVFWRLEVFEGLVSVAGGTFDQPTFWFDVTREVFTRSRAPFLLHDLPDSFETSPSYVPAPPVNDGT